MCPAVQKHFFTSTPQGVGVWVLSTTMLPLGVGVWVLSTTNVEIGVLSSGILSIFLKKTLRADLCITDLKYSFLSSMTLSADLCIRDSKYSFLSSMNS